MIWRAVDEIKPIAPIPAPRRVPGKRRKGLLDRDEHHDEAGQKPRREPADPGEENRTDLLDDEHDADQQDDDQQDGLIDEYA